MSAPKFKRTSVEQTIDLKEIFGVDFKGARSLREAIGGAIIEKIRARTAAGDGMSFDGLGRGRKVKLKSPYSKQYIDSLDFKAFGKKPSQVNMSLTGDMLGLMDIKRQDSNSITIGWSDGTENAKAYNHSTGDTVPRRPFFGVSKAELQEIRREFKSEIESALKTKDSEGRKAFEEKVASLIDDLSGLINPDQGGDDSGS